MYPTMRFSMVVRIPLDWELAEVCEEGVRVGEPGSVGLSIRKSPREQVDRGRCALVETEFVFVFHVRQGKSAVATRKCTLQQVELDTDECEDVIHLTILANVVDGAGGEPCTRKTNGQATTAIPTLASPTMALI